MKKVKTFEVVETKIGIFINGTCYLHTDNKVFADCLDEQINDFLAGDENTKRSIIDIKVVIDKNKKCPSRTLYTLIYEELER